MPLLDLHLRSAYHFYTGSLWDRFWAKIKFVLPYNWQRYAVTFIYIQAFLQFGEQYSVLFAGLTLIIACKRGTLLNQLCNWKLFKFPGVFCYSLYLIHFYLLYHIPPAFKELEAKLQFPNLNIDLRTAIEFPLFVGVCMLISTILFYCIERNMEILKNKLMC